MSNHDEAKAPVKVLFLAANPAMTMAIDEEMRAIEQKVRALTYRYALVL